MYEQEGEADRQGNLDFFWIYIVASDDRSNTLIFVSYKKLLKCL